MNSRKLGARPHSRQHILAAIEEVGIFPVVRVPDPELAFLCVEGIIRAGIPLIEVTLTTPRALWVIEELGKRFGDQLLVGAGSVLDAESCRCALLAGAEFIVSPSFDHGTVEMARRYGAPCIAGALTPREVVMASQAGADLIKIFPCGLAGGPEYIRQLKGPFPQIRVVASQGVNLDNVAEFFAAGASGVALGPEIFEPAAVRQKNIDLIAGNARRFVEAIRSAQSSTRSE